MNIYYLKLSLSRKSVAISERSDVIDLIKRGIEVSNKSFSAQRYHRSLEYLDLQDPKSVLLVMRSRDEVNATRSLSSLTRAMYSIDKNENLGILEPLTVNGCLFDVSIIDKPLLPLTLDDLAGSDDLLLKATVDLVYSSDEERKNELRELLLPYINEKKLR